LPALAGALILHHAARRMEYHPNNAGAMERLRMLLEKVVAWNEGPGGSLQTSMVRGATLNA
jgi:hypothetical protein